MYMYHIACVRTIDSYILVQFCKFCRNFVHTVIVNIFQIANKSFLFDFYFIFMCSSFFLFPFLLSLFHSSRSFSSFSG